MKHFVIITALYFLVCSCSSILYTSERRTRNNTLVFQTDINNVSVSCISKGEKIYELGRTEPTLNESVFQLQYTFSKLRYKHMQIEFGGNNLIPTQKRIKRTPRVIPIIGDAALSIVTFGIPLIIDPFRADFYKVASSSKITSVQMRYTDAYLKQKFENILPNNDKALFKEYAELYPYSPYRQLAINKKDSIEFQEAIVKKDEKAIDLFIIDHPQSVYLDKAKIIKNDMASSRTAFQKAQDESTAKGYEAFVKKYPNAIQAQQAYNKMVELAENEAILLNELSASLYFFDHYLEGYKQYIGNSNYGKMKESITKYIDKQIIDEYANSGASKYESLKTFWGKYVELQLKFSILPKCVEYKQEIYSELFQQLLKSSESSQKDIVKQAYSDFPGLFTSNTTTVDLILQNAKNKNGKIKLYNQNYLTTSNDNLIQPLKQVAEYSYQSNRFNAFHNANIVELTYVNNILTEVLTHVASEKTCQILLNKGKINQVEYYQADKQVIKRAFYQNGILDYAYEYKNGENISLKDLEKKIKEGDLALAQNELDIASFILRKECKNNYPQSVAENNHLQSSLEQLDRKENAVREKKQREEDAERQKREKEESIRKQKEDNNIELVGKWLCNNKFKASENGFTMTIKFEPLDPNYNKSGIMIMNLLNCNYVFHYDVNSNGLSFQANFYQSDCGSRAENKSFSINRNNNTISFNEQGQNFVLPITTSQTNFSTNSSSADNNKTSNSVYLVGKYLAGSNWIVLYPNGTGIGMTDGMFKLPDMTEFQWSAEPEKIIFKFKNKNFGYLDTSWGRCFEKNGKIYLEDYMYRVFIKQ